MKKLLTSLLAVSIAVTGINMTAHAKNMASTNGLHKQEADPHMIAAKGDLWKISAKLERKKDPLEREVFLDKAIKKTNKELDAQIKELAASTDSNDRKNIEKGIKATKLKLSFLTKAKEGESEKSSERLVSAVGGLGFCFGLLVSYLFVRWCWIIFK